MRAASLGMYDLPAVATANDAVWRSLADGLRTRGVAGVPDALDRARPLHDIWDDPALLLGQTCGLPFATRWRGRLRYVATPRYAASGCEGAMHRSLLVARADDPAADVAAFAGRVAAVNDPASNTGARLLARTVAPDADARTFFARTIETGSHLASARAVAAGAADVAAIDAVTWAHIERHAHDVTARLRIVALSPLSPGLPLVTSRDAPDALVDALRSTLAETVAAPGLRWALDLLLIAGVEILPEDAYAALAPPPTRH